MFELELGNSRLILLPERAVLLQASSTLLISDLHVGKSAHFRRAGIPMPGHAHLADIERLTTVISRHAVQTCIVIGDLFHAGFNSEVEAFARWRQTVSLERLVLVKGNHDRHYGNDARQSGVDEMVDSLVLDNLLLVHEPEEPGPSQFTLCGHLHPVITLSGSQGFRDRLPCFMYRGRTLYLPAFTELASGGSIAPILGDRAFAIAGSKVIEVTTVAAG